MNKYLLILATTIISTLLFAPHIIGQVTIGSNTDVNTGSILDLKETNSTTANFTRGLNLPRVALRSISHLYPMLDDLTNYQDGSPTKTQEDAAHTGLVVYNQTTNLTIGLCPGVYVWTSTQWHRLGKPCPGPICEYDIESNLTPGHHYHFYCTDYSSTQANAQQRCKENDITNNDGINTYTYHLMTYQEFIETWNNDTATPTHFGTDTRYYIDYYGWITLGIIHPDGTMEVLNDVGPFAIGPPIGGLLPGNHTVRCLRN